MLAPTQPFTYSFSRTYFENFKANLVSQQSTSGSFNVMFEDYWKEKCIRKQYTNGVWYKANANNEFITADKKVTTTPNIDGVIETCTNDGSYKYRMVVNGIDEGIDLVTFVQNVYNGDQQICLLDKIAREIGQAVADVFGAVGLGDLGCSIGNVISKVFDKFTDVFGSFICTATAEALDSECARKMLAEFKGYRDSRVMTTRKGQQIVRYYQVLGPKIVEAIDADPERELVYAGIMNDYLVPLKTAIDSDDTKEVFRIYFQLMADMVDKYGIKTGMKFRQWVKEYNGLCKN